MGKFIIETDENNNIKMVKEEGKVGGGGVNFSDLSKAFLILLKFCGGLFLALLLLNYAIRIHASNWALIPIVIIIIIYIALVSNKIRKGITRFLHKRKRTNKKFDF